MNDTSLLLSELTHTVDELNRLRSQYNNNNNNNNNNTNTSNLNNSNINSNNIFKEYQKLQQYVKILENEKEQLVIANRHLESKNSFRAKQIIAFEEEKLLSMKKEEDYLDHMSELMKNINTINNELDLSRKELDVVLSKNDMLNKKLNDLFIDEGKGSIIVQYNETKLQLVKLQSKYDDLIIINDQNKNHHDDEIKRLNDRLLSQEKIATLLRNKHEKLEDDYYKLELELQEASSSLHRIQKMKETLEKFVKKNDPTFDHNLYYQYVDSLNVNDLDNNSIISKASSQSSLTRQNLNNKIEEVIATASNTISNINDDNAIQVTVKSSDSSNDKKKKKKVVVPKQNKSKEKPKTLIKLSKSNSKVTAINQDKTNDGDNDENRTDRLLNIASKIDDITKSAIKYNNDDIDNDTITDSVLSDLSFVQQQQQQQQQQHIPNAIKRVVFTGIKKNK